MNATKGETPDLSTIRLFLAVADAGSFAGAAKRVGLSRSALGKAVARLEERLGVRLLHRTTRKVSLTVEGETYLHRMQEIMTGFDDAEAEVRRDPTAPHGTLRLSVPGAYGRLCILPVLQSFLRDWPGLTAEVTFTDRSLDLVGEGLDLAVRLGRGAGGDDVIARVIARSDAVLCAAPDYLDAYGRPRTVSALAGHDRIQFGANGRPSGWALVDEAGQDVKITKNARLTLDSADAIRDMAIAGFGIAQLPRVLIADDLADGRLEVVLPDLPAQKLPISTLFPNRKHVPARVRLFIDRLARDLR